MNEIPVSKYRGWIREDKTRGREFQRKGKFGERIRMGGLKVNRSCRQHRGKKYGVRGKIRP